MSRRVQLETKWKETAVKVSDYVKELEAWKAQVYEQLSAHAKHYSEKLSAHRVGSYTCCY